MEFISKYMRVIKAVLWMLIFFFSYMVYSSINAPIKFNEVKNERFLKLPSIKIRKEQEVR